MSMFNTPSAPSPAQGFMQGQQVAGQQQQMNQQTGAENLAMSAINQYNPYGSLTYQQTGVGPNGVPIYSATTKLSPEQQALLEAQQGRQTTAGGQAAALLGGADYGAQTPAEVIGNRTSGLTGDLVGQYQKYIEPFQQTEWSQLDNKLRNQGLKPGDPGYDVAIRQLNVNQNLANAKATADYENQAFGQASQLYGMPLNMAMTLAGYAAPGSVKDQLVQTPTTNMAPANLIGATANQQEALNQQYQNQLQAQSNMMAGLFGTGSAALGGWARAGFPGASALLGAAALA